MGENTAQKHCTSASRLEHANAAIVFISFQGSKILVTNTITCIFLNDWGTISISEPKRVVKTLAVSVWHTAVTSVWIALAYATFSSFVTRANTFPEPTSHFFVLCHIARKLTRDKRGCCFNILHTFPMPVLTLNRGRFARWWLYKVYRFHPSSVTEIRVNWVQLHKWHTLVNASSVLRVYQIATNLKYEIKKRLYTDSLVKVKYKYGNFGVYDYSLHPIN